jgi:sugar/nucleoside kinase (ribokinase family)
MTHFDLTGIGNAIVDIISPCTDDFLTQNAIEKGAMTLIDQDRAQSLYDAMDTSTETAGGSAGNTMVGFASFGGKGNYIGLVANDSLGDSFANDTRQNGLHFNTPRFEGLLSTATSHIFVTPDGERSMNTYLGACAELSENYIDESQIANSAITYMEGYLFDKDPAKAAFKKSAAIAHKNQRKVSLTLSDSFCVDRHREDFMNLIKSDIDILFANDMELMALFETDNLDDALQAVQSFCAISAITRADKGSIILHDNEKTVINVERVSKVIDSTGAGDQYAAGFLYGLTQGKSMNECGQYASMAASEVISHIGPRPNITYKDLIKAA